MDTRMILIPENMLDAITVMLSPANPGLTKDDVLRFFEASDSDAIDGVDTVFTRREVAQRFKVSLSTINRWLADGVLKKVSLGGCVRISENEIQRLLQQQSA